MAEVVRPLRARDIVAPLLPSLPVAAVASQPATAVLPLLTPILRQRVQYLSASSSEPWIRLLAYDPDKAARLVEVARSDRLEPHPVSGEIEIDWDSHGAGGDVEVRYRRLDVETLQALVLLRDLDLVFRLVYCEGDHEGGGSGWRVGEVSIPDQPHAFASFGGYASVAEAERVFAAGTAKENGVGQSVVEASKLPSPDSANNNNDNDDDDDDDDYWARYDATPGRTPAMKRSPAPTALRSSHNAAAMGDDSNNAYRATEAEDAYYAQNDAVQPAMDNHDPDEVVEEDPAAQQQHLHLHQIPPAPVASNRPSARVPEQAIDDSTDHDDRQRLANLVHPRPASVSSTHSSSNGGSAVLVSKLEESAGRQEQSEFGVKQHVSRSIKSLYLLARASGIDRDEFEQLVKTELDMLSMMDD
ncbi:hypothetical protein SPI_00823 [Niveomyces insectorum RCEF 264]|uniref:Uncharacterized protein n=1 Tax=Niveomyces insectorum RCEF 264 TaxID=1081102 RepID=A0A168AE71_9HYPO|nr:hypothetical protein SPI_00823 [Niveomyces insectorum RCEF 264]